MKVYYDYNTLQWYQNESEKTVTIGGNHLPVSSMPSGPDPVSFELLEKNLHVGPLAGIMIARKKDGTLTGNFPLFMELQKQLTAMNGLSFIFSLEDVEQEKIDGFAYFPDQNSWVRMRFPFPDLVYNRIPFRKSEQNTRHRRFFLMLKEKRIPFFNPGFIDKYELYCLLKDHSVIRNYLPETIPVSLNKALLHFLKKHKSLYLKPSQSAQGSGIYRMKLTEGNRVELEGIHEKKTYQSFQTFWNDWEKSLKNKNYLAQEEIDPACYDGKRFDFRILAHANKDEYTVTGVGIRQSQNQELTTHILNGGRLLPYPILQSTEHDQFIQTVVNEAGKTLSSAFGYFGEFSIDAGVSASGHYYLFEINSKPMSFDEPEIEQRKIRQLCRLFLELTDFD